jgi:peptide/nickel transport system ATP-binding protein
MSLLRIDNLCVSVADSAAAGKGAQQRWPVLENVSLHMQAGEMLGLVGESGCGKSITALSILRLLPQPTVRVDGGSIYFGEHNLLEMPLPQLRALRGDRIAMIFQDPMTALNPVQTVGRQIEEVLLLHRPQWSVQQRRRRVIELLERVRIPAPQERLDAYPHQLSGGMRQRITIAMALACEPQLLVADEPTTALDVTVQAQVLDLIKELQREAGMAVLLITHDLGVIAETCERVAVMYAGRIVEQASATQLFATPRHPYTRGLLASLPARSAAPQQMLATIGGQVPDLGARAPGCVFANRCAARTDICSALPVLANTTADDIASEHRVACFNWRQLASDRVQIDTRGATL